MARALAWHARGHRFDPDILHFALWAAMAKVNKGAWRMPWLTEAMKDVISCDKRGVGANIP